MCLRIVSRGFSVTGLLAFLVCFIALSPALCLASNFTQVMTTGARAWGDWNNDGWADMFAGGTVWTNNHAGGFTQSSLPASGYISLGDYNNDGWIDVMGYRPEEEGNQVTLATNNAGTSWTDSSSKFQTPSEFPMIGRAATWGDFNGDGYLDAYLSGWCNPWLGPAEDDVIYTSNAGNTFTQTWKSSNASSNRYSRGVTTLDFNKDGKLDIYVSAYWLDPDYLWRNDGFNGTTGLTDVHSSYGANDGPGHGIGSTVGDFNNDGNLDIYVSNFAHPGNPTSRFLRNQGPGSSYHFTDLGLCGITQIEPFGSASTADFDNDGYLDLFIGTVGGYGQSGQTRLYRNNGNFTFTDVSAQYGVDALGVSDAVEWGDYNHDGYLDLVAGGKLMRNPGGTNHWLEVKLQGGVIDATHRVNQSAIGAQVSIVVPGLGTLTRQVEGNTGQGNQNDQTLHFGLGSYSGPVDLNIFWPGGYAQTVTGVTVDQLTTVGLNYVPPPDPLSFTLVPVSDPDIPAHYRTYDVMAHTGTNLAVMEMIFNGDGAKAIYQDPMGSNLAPNPALFPTYPQLEFDTYVTMPVDHSIVGGAVDIQQGSTLVFNGQTLNVAWSPTGGASSGPGTFRIGRITLANGSAGNYTIMGWQTGEGFSDPVTLQSVIQASPEQMTLLMVEASDPQGHTPEGYTSYDLVAITDTNLGVMELKLDTNQVGDIYQDPMGGNLAPNPLLFPMFPQLEFDTYVTMPVGHSIVGGAVDIQPGSTLVFDGQHLNVAWAPTGGSQSGFGYFQIGRVTLKDTASGSWTLMGWQTGGWGAAVETGSIVPALLPGDVNEDGFVGGGDLTIIMTNWGLSGQPRNQGDLNGDGFVGGSDYSEVLTYWGTGTPPEAIPEPITLLVIAGGATIPALIRRRRS